MQFMVDEKAVDSRLPKRLFITTDSIGDMWLYSAALARSLGQRGTGVALVTFGPALSDAEKGWVERTRGIELFESGFPLEWTWRYWSEQEQAGNWLLRLASRFRPDLVHLNGLAFAGLELEWPVLVAVHRSQEARWLDVERRPLPKPWEFYRDRVAEGLRSAAVVIAPTHAALASLRARYGHFRSGRVIPFGWHPSKQSKEDKKGFIVAAQQLWDESFNLQALERCAPYLGWPIFCIGERLDSAGERARVQARNICCLGALGEEELEEWLQQSSIYVAPGRFPDGQISILRAAFAGCAMVLGNHPDLKEIWSEAAVFVPPEEPEPIRLALERLIQDAHWRSALAEKARQRAHELSFSAMTGKYCVAYNDVLHPGVRSPNVLSGAIGA